MKETEIRALVSLIEDEDYEVFNHVRDKIRSLGSDAIPFLENEWETNFNPDVQKRIEDLVHDMQFVQLKERFSQWVDTETDDLLKGLWILATYQYPDLEIEELESQINELYEGIKNEFVEGLAPIDYVRLVNKHLFDKVKFRANTKNFHSPGNSMINIVLESKKGSPITMCAVYMLITQKLNLPIYGVNLPNLFILTYQTDELPFYINVFNKGLIFTKTDIDNYL